MENTSDFFMPGPLLFCLKSGRSVCYSVPDNTWHTSEMWYAFNSLRDGVPASRQWRDWDYELAAKMNQYWSNFIKTGDPNGDDLAFWPPADENMGYIDLGAGISTHEEELTDLEKLMMEYTANLFGFPLTPTGSVK